MTFFRNLKANFRPLNIIVESISPNFFEMFTGEPNNCVKFG